jgi:hypothetical protein
MYAFCESNVRFTLNPDSVHCGAEPHAATAGIPPTTSAPAARAVFNFNILCSSVYGVGVFGIGEA